MQPSEEKHVGRIPDLRPGPLNDFAGFFSVRGIVVWVNAIGEHEAWACVPGPAMGRFILGREVPDRAGPPDHTTPHFEIRPLPPARAPQAITVQLPAGAE